MNPLNQITKQVSDLIASMTPAARIMAGLLFATIVVSLGWIITVQQSTSYEFMLGGHVFTEEELKRVEQAFGDAGLPDYVREGLRIKVPRDKKDLYLKAMSSNDALPEEWGSEIQRALSSPNPFEPADLIKLKYEVARERELAGIIKRMPAIDFASVEFDETRHGFARNSEKTASVQVQSRGRKIDAPLLKQIALMTQGYFSGLKLENITVLDLSGTNMFRGSSDPNAADQHPLLKAQTDWEEKYLQQISPLLDSYGDVKLAVGVEIDPILARRKMNNTRNIVLMISNRNINGGSPEVSNR